MTEPSTAVLHQLEQATARRAAEQRATAQPAPPAPLVLKQPTLPDASTAPGGAPAAGNGTAKYLLLDHYFGGSSGTLWTYDGSVWRAAGTAEPSDEQGMAQVAFAANRVDMWWDGNDAVTVVRSWKYL
jgi:hypothetical protein